MNYKYYILLFVLFLSFLGQAQSYKTTYLRSSNGKLIENQEPILVYSNHELTQITNEKLITKTVEFPAELTVINRRKNAIETIGYLSESKMIQTVDSISLAKQTFEFLPETKKILGYNCKKAKTIINSNTIELWYTEELKTKGSPMTLGQNLGLVLEINRNNNFIISATKVEKVKTIPVVKKSPKTLDLLTYRDLLWKSRFVTIPIFKDEIINFSDASKSNDSVFRFANGTIALRKIKFPELKKGSQIFMELKEQSNGDAYDRTGSVFLIPMDKKQSFLDGLQNGSAVLPKYNNGNGKEYQGVVSSENYDCLVELMRFFTPFGIQKYNHIELKDKNWFDIVPYRQDISDMRTLLSNKEVWIGCFIGNYDKGGHKISLEMTLHPDESKILPVEKVIPLFNTTNVMEMAGQEYATMFSSEKGLEMSFTLDKPMKNAKLRYITTGHGGWENGDEFVPKENKIFINGNEIYRIIPWRQDCGSYRLFNPASGNFGNGLSSSDYSRSNWCPGTVTNPIYIDLGDLEVGNYNLKVQIPQGANEGNSFSSWNVSGVLLGE